MLSSLEARRSSYAEVREVLESTLRARRSGSLIRIGDGESVILGYSLSLHHRISLHICGYGSATLNPTLTNCYFLETAYAQPVGRLWFWGSQPCVSVSFMIVMS